MTTTHTLAGQRVIRVEDDQPAPVVGTVEDTFDHGHRVIVRWDCRCDTEHPAGHLISEWANEITPSAGRNPR